MSKRIRLPVCERIFQELTRYIHTRMMHWLKSFYGRCVFAKAYGLHLDRVDVRWFDCCSLIKSRKDECTDDFTWFDLNMCTWLIRCAFSLFRLFFLSLGDFLEIHAMHFFVFEFDLFLDRIKSEHNKIECNLSDRLKFFIKLTFNNSKKKIGIIIHKQAYYHASLTRTLKSRFSSHRHYQRINQDTTKRTLTYNVSNII